MLFYDLELVQGLKHGFEVRAQDPLSLCLLALGLQSFTAVSGFFFFFFNIL